MAEHIVFFFLKIQTQKKKNIYIYIYKELGNC